MDRVINMDKIIISALVVETIIGTLAWERQVKQKIVLDLELYTDISAAASSDDINDAIDYAAVCEQVTNFIEMEQCQLIEALAENTAQFLLNKFFIQGLVLTLSKPGAITTAKNVAVCIKRMI